MSEADGLAFRVFLDQDQRLGRLLREAQRTPMGSGPIIANTIDAYFMRRDVSRSVTDLLFELVYNLKDLSDNLFKQAVEQMKYEKVVFVRADGLELARKEKEHERRTEHDEGRDRATVVQPEPAIDGGGEGHG